MVLNDTRTHVQSSWKACNKRRCVSEATMLGIPKTRKQVMKALALTTPSQLSFHFVV
jgi:lipid II:glycine glycyltransferase (peptidoglycan interpeptide bridge formation enzyme)